MSHFIDNLMKDLGVSPEAIPTLGKPGRPGYLVGTATKEHMDKKTLFGSLGVPEGMDPALCLNEGKHAPVPCSQIFDEKPAHTIMCVLYAKGVKHREIAVHTGYTEVHVRNVLAQPWARKKVNLMMLDVTTQVNDFLREEMIPTFETIIEIRDDRSQPASARLTACDQLTNRFLGKPVQTQLVGKAKQPDMDDAELDRRLAATEARLNDVVMRPPVRESKVVVTETHISTKEITVTSE